MTAESILFALLRLIVCGENIDEKVAQQLEPTLLSEVYTLAQKHDLAHLAGYALEKLGIPDCESKSQFQTAKMRAVYRYLQQEREMQRVLSVLNEAKIAFIPLKGAVLRGYYPEPWMRTSCDLDVLVPEDRVEVAASALVEKLGYSYKGKGDHDLSLFSPGGLHLELHYMAVDHGRFEKAQNVLRRMWEDAVSIDDGGCHKALSDEMFYFYHITHMAKHIENGGCGIRPFLDLWILNHRLTYDPQKRRDLLQEGELVPFAEAAEKLAEVWFTQTKMDLMSERLEQYVLRGGTYGILENRIGIYQTKLGGKGRYALQKIFLPYDRLKYHYPILQKHRFLTPLFEVVRWLKLLFKGGVKRSVRELKMNAGISGDHQSATQEMMSYLGLQK